MDSCSVFWWEMQVNMYIFVEGLVVASVSRYKRACACNECEGLLLYMLQRSAKSASVWFSVHAVFLCNPGCERNWWRWGYAGFTGRSWELNHAVVRPDGCVWHQFFGEFPLLIVIIGRPVFQPWLHKHYYY